MQQLGALGYDGHGLRKQFDAVMCATTAAAQAVCESEKPSDAPAAVDNVQVLVGHLRMFGESAACIAVRCTCNNPCCVNMSGGSEQALVKGSGRTCGGCRVAHYCSPECQLQHWKQHRKVCKSLSAAVTKGKRVQQP